MRIGAAGGDAMSSVRRAVALGLCASLLVAGCATDQAKDVERYRAITAPTSSPTIAAGEPLSLAMAMACAADRNERLAIEGERYIQTMAELQRRSAALLPTVDFGAAFTARDRATESNGESRTTTFDAGPTAQYTLLTGMSDFANVASAERDIETQRWLLLDLRESLLLETARAYYTAWAAERLTEVLRSSARVQEERLRDIRARQEVGLARPLDVAQIEAQVSRTRATLLDAEQTVRDARTVLSLLTAERCDDRVLSDGWSIGDSHRAAQQSDPAGLTGWGDRDALRAIAMERRQDRRAADEAVRSARSSVDAAIGQYAPTITVNLEYFLTRQSLPTERDWTAILSLEVPIFSAGRIAADVRAAWSRFREELLRYSLIERTIHADVDLASERVRSTAARVAEFVRLVELSRETLRQAEGSYGAGLGTNLERLVAQDALLSAELELAREEAEQKVASLALLRAIGTLATGTLTLPERPPPRTSEPLPDSPFLGLRENVPAVERDRKVDS
jgi:outer membrane protein TolC